MEMIYIPSMEVCSVPGLALAKVAHGASHLRQRQATGVGRRPTTRRRSPRVRVTWTPTRVGAGEAGGTGPHPHRRQLPGKSDNAGLRSDPGSRKKDPMTSTLMSAGAASALVPKSNQGAIAEHLTPARRSLPLPPLSHVRCRISVFAQSWFEISLLFEAETGVCFVLRHVDHRDEVLHSTKVELAPSSCRSSQRRSMPRQSNVDRPRLDLKKFQLSA